MYKRKTDQLCAGGKGQGKIYGYLDEGRIFGRSYYGADRSWYTAFLKGDKGDIKCGDEIIPVKGFRPADIGTINKAINTAYEKKYLAKAHNKIWVDGLAEPERVDRTMEFIPV